MLLGSKLHQDETLRGFDAVIVARPIQKETQSREARRISDFEIISLTSEAPRLLERSKSELIGLKLSQILAAPRYRALLTAFINTAETGTPFETLYQHHEAFINEKFRVRCIKTADVVTITINNLHGSEPLEPARFEPARLENAAKPSAESVFKAAFERAGIGMALLGLDGRWLEVNDALSAILGYSPAELCTMRYQQLTHPDDNTTDQDITERLLNGEITQYTLEKRYLQKNGNPVWVELHVALLRDVNDQPSQFITNVQDISARKTTERALESNQERLALALECAEMGWWEYDLVANAHYSSDNFARLLGHEPNTYAGTLEAFLERVHPDDRERLAAMNHDPTEWQFDLEYRIVTPAGETRWLSSRSKTVLGADGEVKRIIGVDTDITARKRIEREWIESQERLSLALESSEMGWWEWDILRNQHRWSDGFARLLDIEPKAYSGDNQAFLERVHPEDRAKLQNRSFQASGWHEDIDYRVLLSDGSERWISSRSRATWNADGALERIIGVDINVTDRKRNERVFQETQVRLSLALESAEMGWWSWSFSDQKLDYSDRFARLLGYEPQEFPGGTQAITARVHPEDLNFIRNMLRNPNLWRTDYDYRVLLENGETRWLSSRSKAFMNPDGTPNRLVGMDMDITARKRSETAFVESQERLSLALESAEMGWWEWDVQHNLHHWSESFERLLGYEPGTQTSSLEAFLERVHPEDRGLLERMTLNPAEWQSVIDYRILRPDGSVHWLSSRSKPLLDASGAVHRIIGVDTDVTERKRTDQAFLESQERLELAMKSAEMGWWEWDVLHDQHRWSDGFARLLGYEPEAYPGSLVAFLERVHPADRTAMSNMVYDPSGWHEDMDYRVLLPDDSERWVSSRSRAIWNADGVLERIIGVDMDISNRKRAEEELVRRATHDPLTNLPNRRLFSDRLEQSIFMARRSDLQLAVVFLDLDRFKVINDTLGHAVGDALLQQVGQRLPLCLRRDDIVARLGGDEFTMILPAVRSVENGKMVAEKILAAFREPFMLDGQEVMVGASLGISLFPSDGEDSETLLRHADDAKRRAKKSGRGQYQFYRSEMTQAAQVQLELERDLRRALDQHQFELHYQPQFDLNDGELVGVEALLRWRHPLKGYIPPNQFIPIAEESGIIVDIGDWVLNEACRQLASWRLEATPRFRMAINVSALQFERNDLVESVKTALYTHKLEARWLEIELTESLVMRDVSGSTRQLQKLRDIGVQVAIDDFGTGYSSLAYLQRLPIDRLKIDRAFIKDLGGEPDTAPLAQAIVALAHTLGMEVVAEGIETNGQLETLRLLRCEIGQGYLMGRPVPASELLERVRERAAAQIGR